jgi:nucleotide sugar dehydrogenase
MISVIGLGFVGGSMKKSFEIKGESVIGYDKYKENTDSFEDCLKSDIAFLALPTIYDEDKMTYDKSAIHEVCGDLEKNNYQGIVVIKSTVEPTTTEGLAKKYNLKFVHNPEFLTAATAFEDFHNQTHIVLGKSKNVQDKEIDVLEKFYKKNYPDAEISRCTCTESESMKSFVNCFYSVKIQFFNELYLLCKKMGCNYDNVKDLMLKNKWINPMHTDVPGPDGKLSYGGYCFPKDTNALAEHMKREGVTCKVLEGTIQERNEMRDDNVNVKLKNETNYVAGFDTEMHVETTKQLNMKYIAPALISGGILSALFILYRKK